jgi:urea transport system permease protein
VAWAGSTLSEQFPSGWTYAQGLLFMLVVAFMPGGLASAAALWRRRSHPGGTAQPEPAGRPVPAASGGD